MSQDASDLQKSRTDANVTAATLREIAANLIAVGMRSEAGGL